MIHLMLHDDWEIYGDGTGDPEKLMFEPAKRLLDICDTYKAKYTFFAEIGQQLNMLEAPSDKWRRHAHTWELTLKDAIARGHDVQLHFHPQWAGAILSGDNWQLKYNNWHSGHVEGEILNEWIGIGKNYLEQLFKPINPDYQVLSYRAGGWLCQPSSSLYVALKNNGIICDVSVMKGRYQKYHDGSFVDFRHALSRYEPWEAHPDDFAKEQKGSGLWELPVFTEESKLPHPVYLLKKTFSPYYYYKTFNKRRVRKGGGYYSPKTIDKDNYKEYYGSFGYMHYKHLGSYLNDIKKNALNNNKVKHIIFLTHSKSFLNYQNFSSFLKQSANDPQIQFSSTQFFIESMLRKYNEEN